MWPEYTRFIAWKRAVDDAIAVKCGMISDDLPDVDYWSLYTAGDTPEEAADYAIAYAMEN